MIVESTAENYLQPILQYEDHSKLWRLAEDYSFTWGKPGFRKRLLMAAGFEYDKASVPRFAWPLFRPDGPWEGAALWHDRLYRDKGEFPHPALFRFETLTGGAWIPDLSKWHRKDADALLEYCGILGGASKQEAALYRAAVSVYPPNWFKGF